MGFACSQYHMFSFLWSLLSEGVTGNLILSSVLGGNNLLGKSRDAQVLFFNSDPASMHWASRLACHGTGVKNMFMH